MNLFLLLRILPPNPTLFPTNLLTSPILLLIGFQCPPPCPKTGLDIWLLNPPPTGPNPPPSPPPPNPPATCPFPPSPPPTCPDPPSQPPICPPPPSPPPTCTLPPNPPPPFPPPT